MFSDKGNFLSRVEIFVWVNVDGMAQIVEYTGEGFTTLDGLAVEGYEGSQWEDTEEDNSDGDGNDDFLGGLFGGGLFGSGGGDPATDDPEWPGQYPPPGFLSLNIRYDDYPEGMHQKDSTVLIA